MENQSQAQPVVSVIMPVYNAKEYLDEALDSVANQTVQDVEIICIDDQSTDGCWDMLNERSKKDSRIVVIRNEENRGAYYSRNRGLEIARGKYIYFMDSDDWLDREAFSVCCEHMEASNLDIIYFTLESFYESEELREKFPGNYRRNRIYTGIYTGQDIFALFTKNGDHRVHLPGAFYRHALIKSNGITFNEHTNNMDDLFYIQSLLLAERVECLTNVFYHRRWRANSLMSVGRGPKNLMARLIIYCEVHKFICKNKPELFISHDNQTKTTQFLQV